MMPQCKPNFIIFQENVQSFPTDLAVAGHIIDGSVFSFCGDLGELILSAPQLSLQEGESVFESGSLLTQ